MIKYTMLDILVSCRPSGGIGIYKQQDISHALILDCRIYVETLQWRCKRALRLCAFLAFNLQVHSRVMLLLSLQQNHRTSALLVFMESATTSLTPASKLFYSCLCVGMHYM